MAIGRACAAGPAGGVDEAGGDGEEPDEEGAGDDEPVAVADAAEQVQPAEQVVGEHGGGEPCAVGGEVPGGHVDAPAPSLRSLMASSTVAWARWNAST